MLAATSRMAGVCGWEYEVAAGTIVWSEIVFEICEWPAGQPPPLERALDLYPPETRPVVAAAIAAAITTAKPFDLVVPFVRAVLHAVMKPSPHSSPKGPPHRSPDGTPDTLPYDTQAAA